MLGLSGAAPGAASKLGCPMACRSRSLHSGVALAVVLLSTPAVAAGLPPIKASETNRVPECATPGRLTAYVRERNAKLDARYDTLASDYMRHGEALHVRWDYAFFQMLLETGYLTYKGDVRPAQNNFAGLGATGRGARGESFKDISTGVRAHLEHLLMYTGEHVESPGAERTRNIQDWGVLTSWQKSISGPITFSQMARKWAPGSRRYASDITAIADRFFDGLCRQPDPQPELVAAVRGESAPRETGSATAAAMVTGSAAGAASPGLEAQRRAIEAAKAEGGGSIRASLGAAPSKTESPIKASAEAKPAAQDAAATPSVTLLNGAPPSDDASASEASASAASKSEGAAGSGKKMEVAALPGAMAGAGKAEQKPSVASRCRVWTASYGGSKAIIIKAVSDNTTNYTVLDVNEGTEKREAEAYINAYAKGGQSVGEFQSQSQALDKAFELCPEG